MILFKNYVELTLNPGECDMRERIRAALEDYRLFLAANREAWRIQHERWGVPAPRAHSLDAEACIASVGLFRAMYDGLPSRLAPLFFDRPGAALEGRLN